VLKFSDTRNVGRTLTGLLLFAAPGVLVISSAISPATDHKNKLEELNAVAAHRGSYLLSSVLFLVGGLLIVAMGIGIMRLFRGSGGVTAGQVSGALLVLGGTVSMAWYALGVAEYEMATKSGLDRQALAAFLHRTDSAGPFVPLFVLFLIGVVLGTVLLAIANWRTRVAPVWASIAILIGGVVGALGNSQAISIVTFAMLLVGLGAIGARVLAMSDDEWEAPRLRHRGRPEAETPAASAAQLVG
jgi:hypothetical protein